MYAENNTFVATDSGIINFSEWPYRDVTPGTSAELVGNIFWGYKRAFENQFSQPGQADPAITFSYGIIDEAFHSLGTRNIEGNPECFGKADEECDQEDCLWREYCLKEKSNDQD